VEREYDLTGGRSWGAGGSLCLPSHPLPPPLYYSVAPPRVWYSLPVYLRSAAVSPGVGLQSHGYTPPTNTTTRREICLKMIVVRREVTYPVRLT